MGYSHSHQEFIRGQQRVAQFGPGILTGLSQEPDGLALFRPGDRTIQQRQPEKLEPFGPQPGEVFRDCDACPEMVVIPPGEFVMGAEFGGRQTESTLQFPHRRRGGYVLFPTIRRLHGFIKKEYTDNIEKVLRKVAR